MPAKRADFRRLLVAVHDPPTIQVVGRDLDLHPVAREDPDAVAPHLAGRIAERLVAVVELDPEHPVAEGLDHLALHLDLFFHAVPFYLLGAGAARGRAAPTLKSYAVTIETSAASGPF